VNVLAARYWHRPFAALRWLLLALLIGLAEPGMVRALDRQQSLQQLNHSAWTVHDGAPRDIVALAQTPDGYLWLGTATGLFRFDGVRFERFRPASRRLSRYISSLLALPDGTLWIGFRDGGVGRLSAGEVVYYEQPEGIPPGVVHDLAPDRDGVIWAAVDGGLIRWNGSHWELEGKDWNYPAKSATAVFVDRSGTLWVACTRTIVFLPRGSRTFHATGVRTNQVTRIAQSPDGALWMAEAVGAARPIPLSVSARAIQASNNDNDAGSSDILFDHDGGLWIATLGDGVRRIPVPDQVTDPKDARPHEVTQLFGQHEGLSAGFVYDLLEDREGNLWMGTANGLDRFRENRVISVTLPEQHHYFALAPAVGGGIVVGSASKDLLGVRNDEVTRIEHGPANVSAAFRDKDNSIWLATYLDLQRYADGRFEHFAFPSVPLYATTTWIARDHAGTLWLAVAGAGIFYWQDSAWTHLAKNSGLLDADSIAQSTDAQGRLWIGYPNNTLGLLDGTNSRLFSLAEGINVGDIQAIDGRGEHLWIGGALGVGWLAGGHFHGLLSSDTEPFLGITGVVETKDGSLWLSEAKGIVQVPAAELRRAIADPSHRVNDEVLDFLDGLTKPLQNREPYPTVVQAEDGLLWFATSDSVVHVDPNHTRTNKTLPPVSIRSVIANHQELAPQEGMRLPLHTTELEIDYTALSLTMPERVRFRYKLEGMHDSWQDAGTRREAFFTNLSPGRYRFHVIASNNDGLWNLTGATLDFVLPPPFFETLGFQLLCAIVLVGGIWLLYRMRLGQVSTQIHTRMEERLIERERIARELHDTLLQSVQGLILRFHAAAARLTPTDPSFTAIAKAIDRAQEVLIEARDRVKDLRGSLDVDGDLSKALIEAAREISQDRPATFRVVVVGQPRPLHPLVLDEVYRIGREAIFNAFQHAEATMIEADIAYDRSSFSIRFRDDGQGFDNEGLQGGERQGHWGLRGMRERADRIRARFYIWSRAGSGTEIELTVPARIAFTERSRPNSSWPSPFRRAPKWMDEDPPT
jgi:signal transduction histidine kinase/ligand-binding sensor domain-containing protein